MALTWRSALTVTLLIAIALLSAGFGSKSVLVTLAVLLSDPVAVEDTVPLRMTWTLLPEDSVPRLQVATLPDTVHVGVPGVTVPGVTPAGSVSVSCTFVAGLGPLLVTVSV
jgi:hypothetical protein